MDPLLHPSDNDDNIHRIHVRTYAVCSDHGSELPWLLPRSSKYCLTGILCKLLRFHKTIRWWMHGFSEAPACSCFDLQPELPSGCPLQGSALYDRHMLRSVILRLLLHKHKYQVHLPDHIKSLHLDNVKYGLHWHCTVSSVSDHRWSPDLSRHCRFPGWYRDGWHRGR